MASTFRTFALAVCCALWAGTLAKPRPALGQGFEGLFNGIPRPERFSEPLAQDRLAANLHRQVVRQAAKLPSVPVRAPTCVTAPTITDFFELGDVQKGAEAIAKPSPQTLSKTQWSVHEAFSLLRATRLGNAILKKFSPKYGFEFQIKQFVRGSRDRSPASSTAALYVPSEKTLYVDKRQELGKVAFVLLHEIVHSLDQDYVKALERERVLRESYAETLRAEALRLEKAGTTPAPGRALASSPAFGKLAELYKTLRQFRDIRLYRAERFAYDASFRAWKELDALYPDYYRKQAGGPRRYEDRWLVKLLELESTTIQAYLQGRCQTAPLAATDF